MPMINDFLLGLEALQAVRAEMSSSPVSHPPLLPSLEAALPRLDLPGQSLLFGVADDGLPVLLSTADPRPGPLLVIGEAGVGKTLLLRSVAKAAVWLHEPDRLQLAVITPTPEGWEGWDNLPHCQGLFSSYSPELKDLFFDLTAWAQDHPRSQTRLLILDDLSALSHLDDDMLQGLLWLLTQGPQRRLWPLVSFNARRALEMRSWLDLFRTRIYGYVADPDVERELTFRPGAQLGRLLPGAQFCLRERGRWLPFWRYA